jgi:calcineurin-like phosphoesterase family protein
MANINTGIPNVWFSGDKHLFHEFMIRGKRNCASCQRPIKATEPEGLTSCCHTSIVQLGPPPRPMFSSIGEMNKTIIDKHNECVEKGDLVYELGDFALKCSAQQARDMRYEMKGNFYLVSGNHDSIAEKIKDCWVWMKELTRIEPKGFECPPITLCHYAMRTWHGSHKGTWQLYGHSHNMLPEEDKWLSFDVGVDAQDFAPISLQQVIDRMKAKIPAWEEWKAGLKKHGGVGW